MTNEEKKEVLEKINTIENGKDKKTRIRKKLRQYFWITLGVLLMDLGYYFFYDPAGIVTGGVTGLAIVLKFLWANSTWFTSSIFLYGIEAVCLLLGLIFIGREFFIKTIYASLLSPTVIFVLERTVSPTIFYDTISLGNEMIICLIMGCLLSGIGVGVALRNSGSTGGMDVVQKIISKYGKMPLSQTMYYTDWVIVIIAGFAFNPFTYKIENVVYGSIGVIVMGYIVDYIALSAKTRRTVYTVTDHPQEIKALIYSELERGVTFSPVVGAYTNQERTMVICTMDKNEAYRIVGMITDLDPKAFTFVTSCKEVRGEYEKRGLI